MKAVSTISILILFMLASCEKENPGLPALCGTWVETTQGLDTMVFNDSRYDFSQEWFELRRESPISTGPYYYRIERDSIYLRWMLSSLYRDKAFYYSRMGEEEFLVGKFYESDISHPVLRFRKISAD